MDESNGVEAAFGKFCADAFRIDRLAPLHLDRLGLEAAFFRDIDPLIRERAAAEAEHFFPGEIA